MKHFYFYSEWCKLPRRHGLKLKEVDVEKDTETALKYKISAVPALIGVEDDEIKYRFYGVRTAER